MAQRTLRTVLAGGALVAALALTSPVPAHAAAGSSSGNFWSWLAGAWDERISVLWMGDGNAQGQYPRRGPARLEKQGVCIDPNGCANSQTTRWIGDGHAQGRHQRRGPARLEKQGGCIDPNGCANSQTTGTAGPACRVWNNAGVCVDPNG